MAKNTKFHAVVILVVLGVLALWSIRAGMTNAAGFHYYCNDDAYITFTYAKHWLAGDGLVFNPGEKVEGYTNFLWLIFLAPWMKLFSSTDISHIAIAWGSVFGVCVLVLTYLLAYQERGHSWLNLIAPALLSMDNTFHYWNVSGLENAMQTTLVLCAFYFLFLTSKPRSLFYAGILFAAATMARPDSGLFWAVAVGSLILRAAKPRGSNATMRDPIQLIAGFLLVMIPYAAFKLLYYGNLLPNTFYLHTGNRMQRIGTGQSYYLLFLQNRFFLPALALAAALGSYSFRRATLMLSVFAFSTYVIWIGGDFFPGSRFLYVLLPILYLLIQEALVTLSSRCAPVAAKAIPVAATIIFAAMIFIGSYGARGEYQNFVRVWTEDDLIRIQLAQDLGTVRREGDSVLAGPIGQIGYYSNMVVLDFWGVIDPKIAQMKTMDAGSGTPGHEKSDMQYLLNKNPTYILFGVDPQNPPPGYSIQEIRVGNRRWPLIKRIGS